jgi:tetratricopeptide (TPR) repeat protein
MKTPFTQLKKLWSLTEDTSTEDLLSYAKNKLESDPNNPELIYAIADMYRHTGDNEAADSYYKKAIKITDNRTQQRAESLEKRIEKKRDKTRAKLLLLIFLPIIAILLTVAITWTYLSKPEPLPKGSNPEKFAFTQWLAKQQMVEVMSTLQAQNPELTFDFSRSATAQSPMEFMQSMMQPDALDKLRREQEAAKNSKDDNGDGKPSFQCSREPTIHCAAHDIPSATGEERKEVTLLMDAYRSVLNTEKDCEKLEKSIENIGQQLHWRKSERGIKADLEDLASECFYKQKNVAKTLEHARKLQCAGDDGYINSVYWYTTAINHYAGDEAKALTSYQCFREATDHIEKNKLFGPAYIASRHRESGALAWLYFDDLSTATDELKKGRAILKKVAKKSRIILDVIGEINLDLMETYVTANIDLDEFQALLEEINSSGRLTDGYKQIKDTLASIYFMQNNDNDSALIHLNNLSKRFKLIPEYVCGWDWSGFRRGLKDSILDDKIRTKATALVDATNCYIPQTTSQRIKSIDSVSKSLRGK